MKNFHLKKQGEKCIKIVYFWKLSSLNLDIINLRETVKIFIIVIDPNGI